MRYALNFKPEPFQGGSVFPKFQLFGSRADGLRGELDLKGNFSFDDLPGTVTTALDRNDERGAIRLAVESGIQDENTLADMVFHTRHKKRDLCAR